MKQLSWIDGLKGTAILAVIVVHCGGGNLRYPFGDIGKIGANGVQLFLVISAFLCALSAERYFEKHAFSFKTAWLWTLNKCIRLIPLYYLSLSVGIMRGGNKYWLAGRNISPGNIISHLLFVHGLFPHYYNSIISVEWYISTLVIYYFLCPYIYKYLHNMRRCVTVTIPVSLLTFWCCSSAVEVYKNNQDAYIYINFFERFSIISQLPVFLMGVLVFTFYKNYTGEDTSESRALSYSLLLFTGFMLYGQAFHINRIHMAYDTTLFGIWFSALLIGQIIHPVAIIDNPVFGFFGRHSYPLYLFHYYILGFYNNRIHFETSSASVNVLIRFVFVLGLSSICSLILIRFFERPILEKLKLLLFRKTADK